ncbi:hypothetical protein ACO9S2_10600 [Nitrospira sp. NS4]
MAQQAGRSIGFADLVVGLPAEYRELGRQVPVEWQQVLSNSSDYE